MTGNITCEPQNSELKRTLAALGVILAAFFLAVWVGCQIPPSGDVGGIISVSSPFDGGFVRGAVKLCMWEIFPLALFAFSGGYIGRLVFAAAVFFLKGAALGASIAFCTENSADAALLGVIVSYCAVALLTAVFFVITSQRRGIGIGYRLLIYFTVCGAASLLRIIPYLLLQHQ